MGMDLKNRAGEELRFGTVGWTFLIHFAERYGWQPRGTLPPESLEPGRQWEGNYDSNDGQYVTPEDARDLAAAVARGLADPNREESSQAVAAYLTGALRAAFPERAARSPERLSVSAFIFADGEGHWRRFVAFAEKDGFHIT
jgi:hypothetical protein